MDWLFIVGIVFFVLVLLFTVAIHEAGHMTAAKIFKLSVPDFSVGFGKSLWSKKTKNTTYNLRMIPLGGYVNIQDDHIPETHMIDWDEPDDEEKELIKKLYDVNYDELTDGKKAELKDANFKTYQKNSFERDSLSKVSPWKRQIIFFAGPLVNIFFGSALLLGLLVATPYNAPANFVGPLDACVASAEGCPAYEQGLRTGDEIVEIDGIPITSFEDLAPAKKNKTELDSIVVVRDGKTIEFKNFQLITVEGKAEGLLGINALKETHRTIPEASAFIVETVKGNIQAVLQLPEKAPKVVQNVVTGEKDLEDPASVIVAGKVYGDMATSEVSFKDKMLNYGYWTAMLNIGIGLLNLAPLLPLDGGRMVVALIDSIKMRFSSLFKREYKPVGRKAFNIVGTTTAIAVFGFMLLIMASDVSALFAGNV